MAGTDIVLFTEQDIEYYKQMSENELQAVMEQMLSVGQRIATNHSFLETAPWYKRAVATISGKTKRTQREIATDSAIMSTYCIQIMREFVNRGLVTQARVNLLEEKVNELYCQFTRLVQATGVAVSAMDEYNTFALALQIGHYSDSLLSAVKIWSIIKRFDNNEEKYNIVLGAIKKYIPSVPRTITERLLEIRDASKTELDYYQEFVIQSNSKIAKAIRICLKLHNFDCLDETGAKKAIETAEISNNNFTIDEFIASFAICE